MKRRKDDSNSDRDTVADIMGIVDDAMPTDPNLPQDRPTVVDDAYIADLRARLEERGGDEESVSVPSDGPELPLELPGLPGPGAERVSGFLDHTTEKLEQELRGALTGKAIRSDSFPPAPIQPFDESIYILCGPDAGRTFTIPNDKDTVSIGRGKDCEIVLADPSVSRRHVMLHRQGDTWTFRDLESENGTYLDGEYVTSGKLSYSRAIEIGTTILVIEKGRRIA